MIAGMARFRVHALALAFVAAVAGCDDGGQGDADVVADGGESDADTETDGEVEGDADADDGAVDGDTGPTPGGLGAACEGNGDCEERLCVTEAMLPEVAGGYCTALCALDDPASCGEDGICADIGIGIPFCLKRCAVEADCRDDHDCVGVCLPGQDVSDPTPTDRLDAADEVLGAAVAAVDEERLRGHVERLSGATAWDGPDGPVAIASRSVFHPDHALAVDYVVAHLSGLGLEVSTQAFDWEVDDGAELLTGQGLNVEARLEGTDPALEPVVVTAHYDSDASFTDGWIAETDPAPGASDNGSGVAVVLELAEVLAALHETDAAPRAFLFLLFDVEELGLIGSFEYVDALAPEAPLLCALNLDMVAWDFDLWPGRFWYAYRPDDAGLAAFDREAIEELVPEADPIYSDATGSMMFGGSDHLPFWEAGRCASYLSNWPVRGLYHTTGDLASTYDWPIFLDVARTAAAVVAARGYRWD
jgi:hypothetical protein